METHNFRVFAPHLSFRSISRRCAAAKRSSTSRSISSDISIIRKTGSLQKLETP